MNQLPASLHVIRGIMGCCFLLADDDASVMIDAGLVGEPFLIRRLIHRLGLRPQSIKTILLTHGHLDHAGNLAWLKTWTGAKVLAHTDEQAHLDGIFPYHGASRWCGRLEAVGRAVLGYHRVAIDEFIYDEQLIPIWGGLRVIHLPGHTLGHCGFYSQKHDLLFSGDMFASYFFNVHKPPVILNSAPELLFASAEKIRQLKPGLMLPCHFDFADGNLHRRRFMQLYGFSDWRSS